MTTTVEKLPSSLLIRWHSTGGLKGASATQYIVVTENGERISVKESEIINIREAGFPLQDLLNSAQVAAVDATLKMQGERDAAIAEIEALTTENNNLKAQVSELKAAIAQLNEPAGEILL